MSDTLSAVKDKARGVLSNKVQSKDSAYLFISFDPTNSTAFKREEPKTWPIAFSCFYELSVKEMEWLDIHIHT